MHRLMFICNWGRKRNKAWSGTCQKIYNALSKHYDIEEIPIKTSIFVKIYMPLYKKIRILPYFWNYEDIRYCDKNVVSDIKNKKECSFMFNEMNVVDNMHSYIYQDMCASYIQKVILSTRCMKKHYNYKVFSKYILKKRVAKQQAFYDRCAGVFVMGEWLRNYLTSQLNVDEKKVWCVGAGYDIPVEEISTDSRQSNKILFVGRDFKRKGGYLLLKAFRFLKENYMSDAELHIVGVNSNLIRKKESGVKYWGELEKEKIVELYSKCDIFCMPSYVEAYGKVYVEALCAGLPCIARNSFASKDIIHDGENGFLIDDDDADILASKMLRLLQDENIKNNVLNKRYYYIKEYSWGNVAAKIAKIIDQDDYMK